MPSWYDDRYVLIEQWIFHQVYTYKDKEYSESQNLKRE